MRLLIVAIPLCVASAAQALTFTPPADTIPRALAQPDAEVIVANCTACHSLDYIVTQPRGKGAQFWRDTVTKMIAVYGAPVAPGDVDGLATQLDAHLSKAESGNSRDQQSLKASN